MKRETSPNPLGDLRAEADRRMLNVAFIETPDFKTLISSTDRSVVVGRRGTGKSALTYHLGRHWKTQDNTTVVVITPEEDQIVGLRGLVSAFGEKFSHLRAGARIAWRYALLLEIASSLALHHKFTNAVTATELQNHVRRWRQLPNGASARLLSVMNTLPKQHSPEATIGALASALHVNEIQELVIHLLDETRSEAIVLVDKLDEGYETDLIGVGIIDGLIQAGIDINTRLESARTTMFLRDNIFRAVAQLDMDYSRNIEGQVLRLHWDEFQLMNLVATRLRVAFGLEVESDLKVWNRCTARDLVGREGFRRCLQLTLYRPRDIIALLNQAFYTASKQGRTEIIGEDIESTGKEISQSRLDDLHKEYSVIFPGLDRFTSAFAHSTPEKDVNEVYSTLNTVISRDDYPPQVQQHFAMLGDAKEVAKALYSVGFLGAKDTTSGNYIFCHDGKAPTRDFVSGDRMLVHPCYRMALNQNVEMDRDAAEEIHDEYDIEVTSATPQIRQARIGKIIGQLSQIPIGDDGAREFEEWCLAVVRMLWAGHIRNVQLHPNRNATQRRDIVARVESEKGSFRRIREDYETRQLIFEVKNYKDLGPEENRQMVGYLTREYGRLGFIITRDDDIEVHAGKELEWIRELDRRNPPVRVIRLTGKWLGKVLSKARSPQKHDEPEQQLGKLLDTYERLYSVGQTSRDPNDAERRRQRRRKRRS